MTTCNLLDDLLKNYRKGKAQHNSASISHPKKWPARSLSEQVLTAKQLPQAVVNITSFGKGKGHVQKHLNYISRNTELPLENQDGRHILTRMEQEVTVEDWAMDFGERLNSRDTIHLVLSAPTGSNALKVTQAARDFLRDTFGKSHLYLFATHTDTQHPHVHTVIKCRSELGQKLNPRKTDLSRWRKDFAAHCRSQGIQVEASRRFERGLAGPSQKSVFWHLKKRGIQPNRDKVCEARAKVEHKLFPWEVKMQQRNQWMRGQYINAARKAAQASQHVADTQQQQTAYRLAKTLDGYAKKMPLEQSRDAILRAQWLEVPPSSGQTQADAAYLKLKSKKHLPSKTVEKIGQQERELGD